MAQRHNLVSGWESCLRACFFPLAVRAEPSPNSIRLIVAGFAVRSLPAPMPPHSPLFSSARLATRCIRVHVCIAVCSAPFCSGLGSLVGKRGVCMSCTSSWARRCMTTSSSTISSIWQRLMDALPYVVWHSEGLEEGVCSAADCGSVRGRRFVVVAVGRSAIGGFHDKRHHSVWGTQKLHTPNMLMGWLADLEHWAGWVVWDGRAGDWAAERPSNSAAAVPRAVHHQQPVSRGAFHRSPPRLLRGTTSLCCS